MRQARRLALGAALALVAHASSVALLIASGRSSARAAAVVMTPWADLESPFAEPATADAIDVSPPEPDSVPPAAEPFVAPAGDDTRQIAWPTAPARGMTNDPRAPTADQGDGQGRTLPEATRRDRVTMRGRLDDGAATYQLARERTAMTATTTQALRREPKVGQGDARLTSLPREALATSPRVPDSADDDGAGLPPETAARADEPRETHDVKARGEGPLDADRGPRSFDVPDLAARAPRDVLDQRAASNERQPGLFDLSAAATPGTSAHGHGAASQPGATACATDGVAPSTRGAIVDADAGDEVALSSVERVVDPDTRAILARIRATRGFPRRLALLLEQGESIIRFRVRSNGTLDGPIVLVKSAGFVDFDAEAVASVIRAAPFPRMARDHAILLRVPFQNPLVR